MATQGLPDMAAAARRANAKLQRLENARAKREGRAPVDLRAQAAEARRRILAGSSR